MGSDDIVISVTGSARWYFDEIQECLDDDGREAYLWRCGYRDIPFSFPLRRGSKAVRGKLMSRDADFFINNQLKSFRPV